MVLDSSTVMTPSLPTFSMASAILSPMLVSPEEMEATWVISRWLSMGLLWAARLCTAASVAISMPFFTTIGFAPAATFFRPSRTMAWASRVAVVVPSPATSLVFTETSRTSWAPMFSKGSSSSISLAMVTPSLVISGAPNFLSSTTLRPLGPRVIFTVSASMSMPVCSALRASSPYLICFAMIFYLPAVD